ncbi:hypothetical protein V2J09_018212, partial [Rumex salicifolius]
EYAKKSGERLESRKSHSWWWDSHINPKNAKWLSENMEEMDNNVDRMMKLIEDDGDSFAKKAEMYYKRRPELISHVQEFQRMYQALAERYAQLTADLRKNVVPDLHSVLSDVGSETNSPWFSPEMKSTRFRSSHRAAGFDVFLGSGGSTDRYYRGDEISSSLSDSEESDISSVHSYPRYPVSSEEVSLENGSLKRTESVSLIELQLKIVSYEEEIANLKAELKNIKTMNSAELLSNNDSDLDAPEVADPDQKTQAVVKQLRATKGRLLDLESQVMRLSTENKLAHESINKLQDQLKTAQKDGAVLRAKLDSEIRKSSKWQDRIARYKASLIDRDVEVRELKDLVCDANMKYQLHDEISRLSDEKSQVEQKFREVEVRCHTLETQHSILEKKMSDEIEVLQADISEKRDQLETLDKNLNDLILKYDSLVSERDELSTQVATLKPEASLSNELKLVVDEIKDEVERQKVLIMEGEEQKREAIRQLCFSIDHYRNDYEQLRRAFIGRKRLSVFAQ